jgi:hypothetical protein
MNYYCTLYSVHRNHVEWLCGITPATCQITSTPYNECTRSHQLRTMNERGHTNFVPWMNAVTPTPYHECTQFVDTVKPLLFRPITYIHGTELVWQHSFMVWSWCDLVKWPYRVQKSAWSDFDQSKWLQKLLSGVHQFFADLVMKSI